MALVAQLSTNLDNVRQAILSEAQADQLFLTQSHDKFDNILTTLNTAQNEINRLSGEFQTSRGAHISCRTTTEHNACVNKQTCDKALYNHMADFIEKENRFLSAAQAMDLLVCDGNVSDADVRDNLASAAAGFEQLQADSAGARSLYNSKKGECDGFHDGLQQAWSQCNANQTAMETSSCAVVQETLKAIREFHKSWKHQHASYQGVTEMISKQEWDRRREYGRLVAIDCILKRLEQLNGRPCDSSDLTADDPQMTECESQVNQLDLCSDTTTQVLCFTFSNPPNDPSLPAVPAYPCTPAWLADQMASPPLQAVPQIPFDSDNIGCNAWPPCEKCDGLDTSLPDATYHKWTVPVDSLNANHTDAYNHATQQNYINETGSVNYDSAGNPLATDSGWNATAVNENAQDGE